MNELALFAGGGVVSSHPSCSDGAPSALLKLMPALGTSCSIASGMGLSNNFRSGTMYEHSTVVHGEAMCKQSQPDSHVRTSASAEKALESMAHDLDYGWKQPESFAKFDPNSSCWKTRQCSLIGGLAEFSETWPEWGSMVDGECSERPALERRTIAPGFTWLLTPTAQSWKAWTFRNPLALIRKNHADGNLQEQLMRLYQRMTTPRCQEILMMWPEGWTDSKPLAMDGFRQWQQEHSLHFQDNKS